MLGFLLSDEALTSRVKTFTFILIIYFCTKLNKILFCSSESTVDPKSKVFVFTWTGRTEIESNSSCLKLMYKGQDNRK